MRLTLLTGFIAVAAASIAHAQTAPAVTGPYVFVNGDGTAAAWIASGTLARSGDIARVTSVSVLMQPKPAGGKLLGRSDIEMEMNCATGQRRYVTYAARGMDNGVLEAGTLDQPWEMVDRSQFGAALIFDYACRGIVPAGPQPTDLDATIRDYRARFPASTPSGS